VKARRQRDQSRGAEQRNGFEKADDEAAQDCRQHQRQRHLKGGAQNSGAEDVCRVLHLGRHQIESRASEHEHVRKRGDGDHDDETGHGIDVEYAVLRA
jgi:hypothetical protein